MDGGRRGPKVASSGISSDASIDSVSENEPIVKGNSADGQYAFLTDEGEYTDEQYIAEQMKIVTAAEKTVAVIEFDSEIDPIYIAHDGGAEEYHTTVTVFEPDVTRSGMPFDYLEY